jgi:hypothetical protein
MRTRLFLVILLLGVDPTRAGDAVPEATFVHDAERIQPYAKNPFYRQIRGQPVLLLGGTDDDNLFQWERTKLEAHLDLLISVGGNYTAGESGLLTEVSSTAACFRSASLSARPRARSTT